MDKVIFVTIMDFMYLFRLVRIVCLKTKTKGIQNYQLQ